MSAAAQAVIVVPKIHCPWCQIPRFDDGTPCKECGEYAALIQPQGRIYKGQPLPAPRCAACSKSAARQYLFGKPICGEENCREMMRRMYGPKDRKVQ